MICDCIRQSNEAKYARLDDELVNTSVPVGDDYEDIDWEKELNGEDKKNSWVVPAIIGAGLLLILKH